MLLYCLVLFVCMYNRSFTLSVDCAGILKLKNADIELRKGETDVGRKNTRVRLVFRVHVPQPGGQWLSLQAASHPIECCKYHRLICCNNDRTHFLAYDFPFD